ncbi:MAG: HAD family hydrolase [Nanoarchaeota archaeon]|nr:HAD family hydrolase [Nanoarchaeota archaeon]
MKVAAFFDLDGTIVRGVSSVRFSRFLIRRKILPIKLSVLKPTLKTVFNYFKGNIKEYMDGADDIMAASMKGLSKKVIELQAKQYVRLELDKVYKKTLKAINEHKSKNHLLFLLSASFDELVKEFGKLLGFDESIGTRLETRKGVYTGVIKSPSMIGEDRAVIVKKLAKKYNVDLSKSFAYGDSFNDKEVLKIVGNPFVVNPDDFMRKTARKKNWKVL